MNNMNNTYANIKKKSSFLNVLFYKKTMDLSYIIFNIGMKILCALNLIITPIILTTNKKFISFFELSPSEIDFGRFVIIYLISFCISALIDMIIVILIIGISHLVAFFKKLFAIRKLQYLPITVDDMKKLNISLVQLLLLIWNTEHVKTAYYSNYFHSKEESLTHFSYSVKKYIYEANHEIRKAIDVYYNFKNIDRKQFINDLKNQFTFSFNFEPEECHLSFIMDTFLPEKL